MTLKVQKLQRGWGSESVPDGPYPDILAGGGGGGGGGGVLLPGCIFGFMVI